MPNIDDIKAFNELYDKFGQKASDHLLMVRDGKLMVREKPNWFLRIFANPFSKERSNYLLRSDSNLTEKIHQIDIELKDMKYNASNVNDIAKYVKNVNKILDYVM